MSSRVNLRLLLVALFIGLSSVTAFAEPVREVADPAKPPQNWIATADTKLGVSANPGATDATPGTGTVGRMIQDWLGAGKDTGVWFGGLWIGDANFLISGGAQPGKCTLNSLVILGLRLDAEKLGGWKGGKFGAEFLQFNGSPTNDQAGSVQGYNSLPGPEPLNRSELYQLWWRQSLFDDKFTFRIGKVVPTYDFNNVQRPVPAQDESLQIPAVSGLIFTPIFINPTLLGAMPGYYNSAYGITATFAPTKQVYFSYGFYDGNLAKGTQTGMRGPQFNGYYFQVGEMGAAWTLAGLPGSAGLGGWRQTGLLAGPGVTENGAVGFYLFGSQRLWRMRPHIDNSGISIYVHGGANNSKTLPVNQYVGGGLTGFALLPGRPNDSCGIGVASSWLNQNIFQRSSEVMIQSYYQMNLIGSTYLQPVVSYIPTPGSAPKLDSAWAVTLRFIALF